MSNLFTLPAPLSPSLEEVDWQVLVSLDSLIVQERTSGKIVEEIRLEGVTKVEQETSCT